MGCGSSKTAVPLRPSEITMTFISRPISDDEKSVISNFFIVADDDQNGTISDEELGALLARFISESGSVDKAVVHHVSKCLRGERNGKVNGTRVGVDTALTTPLLDPSDRRPIDQETVTKWWPSILDFVNRYQHACQATFVPKCDFGFDTLILPFRDNGVGKVVVGDVPKLIDKITSACFEGECVYADSTFEPNEKALGKRDGTISWKRIRDLHPSPILYKDGSCAGDVICKGFGVNFYSAGISSLGQRFDLLVSAIYPPHYNPAGIYGVRLLLEETWVWLIVDDCVPVKTITTTMPNKKKDGNKKHNNKKVDIEPAFMMSAMQDEMWPLIIDKAFAKLKGSYTVLHRNRSLLLDPLALVVGCSPSIYTVVGINPVDRADEMWNVTKFYMDKRWFLTASPVVEDPSSGLVVEHAYSILGYITNEDDKDRNQPVVRLCRCRNPWGSGEWKGKWNDTDTASWDAYPTLKNKVKSTRVDDGTFWIAIEDVAARFRNFHCHAVRPDIDRASAEHSLKKSENKEASKNPLSRDADEDDEDGSFGVEPQAILGTLSGSSTNYPTVAATTASPPKRQPTAITMITDDAHDNDGRKGGVRSKENSFDSSGSSSKVLARMSSMKGIQHDLTRVNKLSPFTNMQWFTFRQCWQECYSDLAEMEKTAKAFPVKETHSSVFEGLPQQCTTNKDSSPAALMSPFDCPQYLLEVPVGETCEFLFRAIRKLDLDQNGVDDDSDSDFDPVDVIRTHSNAVDCPLPHTYLVRGKDRLHVIPTRTIAEAFGGFARVELKPGSYILFVMAFQRGDVPIKLVTKSKKALPITRLPPMTTAPSALPNPPASPIPVTRRNLVVIQGILPAIGPQLDSLLKKDQDNDKKTKKDEKETNKVGKLFSTRIICTPPSPAMKAVYFALLVDHRFDYLDGSGSVALGTARDPLQGNTFQWTDFREHDTTNTTVCSLAALGSGKEFSLYPFFTGAPRNTPIPFTLIAWGDDHNSESEEGGPQLTLTLAAAVIGNKS